MGWCGLNGSGSEQGEVNRSCECSNKLSDSIKWWETIERLRNW
jgi:hypothetical protein